MAIQCTLHAGLVIMSTSDVQFGSTRFDQLSMVLKILIQTWFRSQIQIPLKLTSFLGRTAMRPLVYTPVTMNMQ